MSNFSVRVPPDSTGKRVSTNLHLDISYTSGVSDFVIGERITTISGLNGLVVKQSGTQAEGAIHLLIDSELSTIESVSAGELLKSGGTTRATVVSSTGYYTQSISVVGANNPLNGVNVDNRGALTIRSYEGSWQFDSFGRLQTAQPYTIADYVYAYNDLPTKFSTKVTGNGTSSYDSAKFSVVLACTTTSGDKIQRRTNLYHKSLSSLSQYIEMSVGIGDIGKSNVRRRWGYYEDNFGIFFELDGTTLNAVFRTHTSGVVLENRIPQSQWNTDRINGAQGEFNISGESIDVSKINSYWFDLQCSAGKARCGVFIDGVRIICHSFNIGNHFSNEHLVIGTAPISYEQENTGVSVSSSEMRVLCAKVMCEGTFNPTEKNFSKDTSDTLVTVSSSTVYTPLISFRSKTTFEGKSNHIWILPQLIDVYSDTSPILIELVKNPTLTGESFTSVSDSSSAEYDLNASAATSGEVVYLFFAPGGSLKSFPIEKNYQKNLITTQAWTDLPSNVYTIRAKLLKNGLTQTGVRISVNWGELQ